MKNRRFGKSGVLRFMWLLAVFTAMVLALGGCGGGGGDDGNDDGGDNGDITPPVIDDTALTETTAVLTTGLFQDASSDLSAVSVGSGGGTLEITDPASPLAGLEIMVPEGATDEVISFTVSYADISGETGLPEGTESRSKLIRIQASGSDAWNTYAMFDKAVLVTLPYDASTNDIVGFYVYNSDGTLEPTGLEVMDTNNGTVSFWTRTFANTADTTSVAGSLQTSGLRTASIASATYLSYLAVGIAQQTWADWTNQGSVINTGFTAAANGWYIPNYGAYYKASRGGNCMGMVGFAKFYFRKAYATVLHSNYRDATPTTTWLDDDVAIELASRVHNGMADIWNQYVSQELNLQTQSSLSVARSLAGALYVTGNPALLYIQQVVNNNYSGAHAIMTYRADIDTSGNITFYIYDPNFPGADNRRITYVNGTGFNSYASGTSAASSRFSYNYLKHFGFHVGMSDAALSELKTSADAGFTGSSVFPTLTVTAITGTMNDEDVLANTDTTDQGQEKLVTADTNVRIQGTVLGGLAQTAGSVVNNLRVLTPQGNYSTPVDNQAGSGTGEFDITIPLLTGENMVALVASKYRSFSHWAAFKLLIIDSTASHADLTVTMSWGQNQSDVDLYVKEPDGDGKTGDTVYFQNREGTSTTNPFLDLDNTSGYGPEHYIAKNGMKTRYSDGSESTGLYGDYESRIHYYYDDDEDYEEDQPITWTLSWRYLAFCPEPCDNPETDGFWVTDSRSGSLAVADSGNCCDIDNMSGGDWSSTITISYPEPDLNDYIVPEPPAVMLP